MEDFREQLIKLIPKLLIYARSLSNNLSDAEDLVQTSLEKALRSEASFDGVNLQAWVKTILKNTFLTSLRKSREVELSEGMEEEGIEGDQQASLLKKDIERCLGELKELDREAVTLKGRGFSYKEISEFTDTTLGNLRVILHRARKQLHICLEGKAA